MIGASIIGAENTPDVGAALLLVVFMCPSMIGLKNFAVFLD